jgi:hypothetical protein
MRRYGKMGFSYSLISSYVISILMSHVTKEIEKDVVDRE